MPEFNWDDLRFLLALTRSGSLAGAAKRLGVNESTVARRIARFEAELGARLIERSGGSLRPSEAGARVLAAAERVEFETQAIASQVSGEDSRLAGTVRLTAVPLLVNRVLTPALPDLLRDHPALEIELIAEPRDLSLTKREADIALRLARPRTEARNLARRIGTLGYAVYGPAQPDAQTLPWVTYEDSLTDLPQARWIAERLNAEGAIAAQLKVNDAEGLLQSLRAGLGKSLLPARIADEDASLRRIEGYPPGPLRELWLITHPELTGLPRIRAVADWLAELFK